MSKPVKNKQSLADDVGKLVLVFGHGQIAEFIPEYFDHVVISSADVTKPNEIEADFAKYQPAVVINTAAKTSIDWCELNKLEAFNINTLGAYNVWQACQKFGAFLVHFSSGCIFSSKTKEEIYKEDDIPNPQCYYSWTKVWAENMLGKDSNLLTIRPRVIISSKIDRRNTLSKWMVYSHFVSDQNTVTIVENMLPVLKQLVDKRIHGTFHIANKNTISPLEAAHMLKEKINQEMKIHETTLEEVNKNLVAKRVTTVLNTDALKNVGFELPSVTEAVPKMIEKFKKNLEKAGGLIALDKIREEAKAKYKIIGKVPTTFADEN